ncbi:MAG: hypothetical protein HOP28_09295 [Gemmatimonadales bacterium]|nr:hypothetical protein [Gemmatimonadales bacterium]
MRSAVGPFALLLLGCQAGVPAGSPEAAPGPPAGPAPGAFRIEPSNPHTAAGATIQLRALSEMGAPVPVFWRLAEPSVGRIDADGEVYGCGGMSLVRALLKSDTTRTASTTLHVAVVLTGGVSVADMRLSQTTTPARIDSIAGPVEVVVAVNPVPCRNVLGVRLELASDQGVTVLGALTFSPSPTATIRHSFDWDPAMTPNGNYNLRAVRLVEGFGEETSNSVPVTVRHP